MPPKSIDIAKLFLLCLLLPMGACSSCNETPPDTSNSTSPPIVACQSSAECVDEDAGKLCVDGACVACEQDAECAADTAYGEANGFCKEGVCGACEPGTPGCACDDQGMCASSECIADVCVMCDRGDLDCVCRNNGTCKAGNQCDAASNLCVACEPGVEGCPCDAGACGDGLVCQSEVCVPDPCTDGATGCPCDNGSCTSGGDYCDGMGVCQECSSDVPGCECAPGDVCEGDNYCDAQTVCQACPESDRPETCGCTESSVCAQGLVCDQEDFECRPVLTCADLGCGNFVCDDSLEDAVCLEDQCIEGYTFDAGTGSCVAATPDRCLDEAGDPTEAAIACEMMSKACVDTTGGVACVDTCATLSCPSSNRDCVPAATPQQDAACGVCVPGFVEETDQNGVTSCVRDAAANCSPADPNSIRTVCDGRFQQCVSDAQGAYCGECSDGRYFDLDSNKCVEIVFCGNSICGDGEFCFYPQDGSAPSCANTCMDGEAFNEESGQCEACAVQCADGENFPAMISVPDGNGGTTQTCACADDVFCSYHSDGTSARCFESECESGEARTSAGNTCSSCNLNCLTVPGATGRVWPIKNIAGDCLCETRDGFYYQLGGSSSALECDLDRDGWINQQARTTYGNALNVQDQSQLGNFRCQLREVDRVRLVNEYGQRRDVALCNGLFYDWNPSVGPPPECATQQDRATVILYEPDTIDDDQKMSSQPEFPSYGSRLLRASEVNPMTKACINASADYNDNGVPDLTEAQPLKKGDLGDPAATDEEYFFRAFANFVELHTAYYRPPSLANEPGIYVIEERSRCDDDFPLRYENPRDGFYWDQCTRSRRGDFDGAAEGRPGFDFANYHCDAMTGACQLEDLSILATGSDGADLDVIPDHDLCALDAANMLPLSSDSWLGMTHHSQFQCVSFQSGVVAANEYHKVSISNVYEGGVGSPQFTANGCDADQMCNPMDANCQESVPKVPTSDPVLGVIAQPRAPKFTCQRRASSMLSNDQVGFANVRYLRSSDSASLAWSNGSYIRGCVDESEGTDGFGFSNYCGGSPNNSNGSGGNQSPSGGLLTGANAGDYGRLICSCNDNYSGNDCSVVCTSGLHVGGVSTQFDSAAPITAAQKAEWDCGDDYFCKLYPTVQGANGGFPGGRRGFWLCGEQVLNAHVTGEPTNSGTDAQGSVYKLEGKIERVPIGRTPLKSACPANAPCYESF